MDHPDGLLLQTRESQPFLVLNGIQTQSALVYNLINELQEMRDLGVDVLRISPQSQHTAQIAGLFRQVADGVLTGSQAFDQALPLMPAGPCNGYWHGKPGLELLVRSEEHTSELQSLMRISYAVFCLKKKKKSTK